MANILFEHGATVELKECLSSPLFAAIRCCNIVAIKLIYKAGAQPNVTNDEWEPVLFFAVRILQMLLEGREDPDTSFLPMSTRAMHSKSSPVTEQDANSVIRALLENGEDVNSQSNDGTSSLQVALRSSKTASIVDIFLSQGADIHVVNELGHGVFHDAVESGHVKFIHLLFDLGADCNQRTQTGATPIALAAAHGYDTIVGLLLVNENLDDLNKNEADWSATSQLNYAIMQGDIDLFRSIQDKHLSTLL